MLPTGWQLQADPTWVEARAPPSSTEVNRLRPGCLGLWGSFHPPGSSSFQTGSYLRSLLSARDRAGPRLWPQQSPGHMAWAQTVAAVAPAFRWEKEECPGL